ncbi:hypothetical protein EOL96_07050 [Candidatus Saccharibacteria bacterium]|nr:hypothetical protein [Candidatus Saccharibacteria bacterium]
MFRHNIKTHERLDDKGGWRHLVRPIGAITAAVITAGTVVGYTVSAGEDGNRDILPSTSQGDTYIPPDPLESIPLNLDGIFTEGTVGEEALPVVTSDSGICFDGGTTREIGPMYYVDEGAVDSLVLAIEQATSELKTAREAGDLLGGVAPNGAEVYFQLGYPERSQYIVAGNELISENRPDTVYIDILDTATGAVYKLLLFHEKASEGCEQGDWWVGTAYGPPSTASQVKRFGEVIGAANHATGFKIAKQGAIDSKGPIIRFA